MLRAYGPGCDGSVVEAKLERIPDERDLDRPRGADRGRREAGRAVHPDGRADRGRNGGDRAVEPPLRAGRRALHDGQRPLRRRGGTAATTPISFVLADNRLVTIRYATPKPIRAFAEHARRDRELVKRRADGVGAHARCDHRPPRRRARERQRGDGADLAAHIFHKDMDERRIPAARLTALLTRIGRTQTLLTKIRYSAVSTLTDAELPVRREPASPRGQWRGAPPPYRPA